MKHLFLFLSFFVLSALHGEDIPKPTQYVNDCVGILSPKVVKNINSSLADFERRTSNQVVVVIAKNFDGSLDETCNRLFHKWGIGQKGKNNGVVLFVFTEPHKIRIEVGYGLEGTLPDATASEIIRNDIGPFFTAGQWDKGVVSGVAAIMRAVQGEYQGTGQTVHDKQTDPNLIYTAIVFVGIILLALVVTVTVSNYIADRLRAPSGRDGDEVSPDYAPRRRGDDDDDELDSSSSNISDSTGAFLAGAALGALSTRHSNHDDDDDDDDDDDSFSSGGGDSGGGGADGSY